MDKDAGLQNRPLILGVLGVALAVGVIGGIALVGNSGGGNTVPTNGGVCNVTMPAVQVPAGANFADGSYTARGEYCSPGGKEHVDVTLQVAANRVVSVELETNAATSTSAFYQGLFKDGVAGEVVGEELEEIDSLARVNGSSLTPLGFRNAVLQIQAEAAI